MRVCDDLSDLPQDIEPLIHGQCLPLFTEKVVKAGSVRRVAQEEHGTELALRRCVRFKNARVIDPVEEFKFAEGCRFDNLPVQLGRLSRHHEDSGYTTSGL